MTSEPLFQRIVLAGPKVKVPARFVPVIERVRAGGTCNLLDVPCVAAELLRLGHPEAAGWIAADRGRWGRAVLQGIEPEPDDSP
jgi:hypothetical protein